MSLMSPYDIKRPTGPDSPLFKAAVIAYNMGICP